MKVTTAVSRIMARDCSDSLKILKLQVLALRCFPSSPNQKFVIATYRALQEKGSPSCPTNSNVPRPR